MTRLVLASTSRYRAEVLRRLGVPFEAIAPDGTKLRRGQIATAYTSSHINFTIANGGTMTAGDYFNIPVAKPAAGKRDCHSSSPVCLLYALIS